LMSKWKTGLSTETGLAYLLLLLIYKEFKKRMT